MRIVGAEPFYVTRPLCSSGLTVYDGTNGALEPVDAYLARLDTILTSGRPA